MGIEEWVKKQGNSNYSEFKEIVNTIPIHA